MILQELYQKARRRPDNADAVMDFLTSGDISRVAPGGSNEFVLDQRPGDEVLNPPILHVGGPSYALLTPTRLRRTGFLGRNLEVCAVATPATLRPREGAREATRSFFFVEQLRNRLVESFVVFDVNARDLPHISLRKVATQAKEQIVNQFPLEERALGYIARDSNAALI